MADSNKTSSVPQNSGTANVSGDAGTSTDNEDSDEPLSSSSNKINPVEDVLSSFREQWQRELVINPQQYPTRKHGGKNEKSISDKTDSDEATAKALFLKGVEQEQAGNMYEAIQFYKKAVQLVPDIEFKLYESSKVKPKEKSEINSSDDTEEGVYEQRNVIEGAEIVEENFEELDLTLRFERIVSRAHCLCFPHFNTQNTHISALPMEIVLYILRWVVSSELDLRSLETFGSACRGYYLCSRDSEIWRLACARVWGLNCGSLQTSCFKTWRQMFIERPRLRYNGCYINKTTYVRHGENSFQDQFYRPWHLVEYYRYLRFFSDGLVLMLTTPDEPAQCVTQLRYRSPKNPNILVGHYRLRDRCVTLLVQKQDQASKFSAMSHRLHRRREPVVEGSTQTFQMDLQIQNHRKRAHAQLAFTEYTVFTKHRNGTQSSSNFELVGARYPPLWFSRVKSYTAESESPLQ